MTQAPPQAPNAPQLLDAVSANHAFCHTTDDVTGAQCTKRCALWESGLDNSPMYDTSEVQWDYPDDPSKTVPIGTSCRMHLYDVGMSGLYVVVAPSLEAVLFYSRYDGGACVPLHHTFRSVCFNQLLTL
jgi:hypothetical protein